MRPMLLDAAARVRLRCLRAHAEAHPVGVDRMRRMEAGEEPPIGEDPLFVTRVESGFRVAFSIEEHPQPDGSTRRLQHLSVSVPGPGRFPHPRAVEELKDAIGIEHELHDCRLWVEEFPGGGAINLAAPMNGEEIG